MRAFKPEEILKNKDNEQLNTTKHDKTLIHIDSKTRRLIMALGVTIFSLVLVFVNLTSTAKTGGSSNSLIANSQQIIDKVYGYAITVDGKAEVYVADNSMGEKVLTEIEKANLPADESLTVKKIYFKQDIALKATWVDKKLIKDAETATNYLLYGNTTVQKYTAKEGDNLWLIARRNNMRVKEILAANPGLDESKLAIGQEIFLKRSKPKVTVVAVLDGQKKNKIPYDTKIVKDSKMQRGKEKTVTEGKNGTRLFTYEITAVNGTVTDKKVLADKIVEKPVTKVVASGSARRTMLIASRSGESEASGSGNLLWPARGRISSHFGYRGSEYHTGMDIDGSTGDSVVAVDGGRVIMTGWNGGYGKTVVIDHGNGVVTRYAHLSSYSVSEGEKVGRGEYIGAVGSTGRSTGSHLHFEVIVNGSPRNPLKYLN